MNSLIQLFLDLLPIIWLIISLGVFKMPAVKATSIGLALTVLLSILGGKLTVTKTFLGALDGATMGLIVISYVVVAALFAYNSASYSGNMRVIQNALSHVSTDPRILVLLVCWAFGAFLESVAGFGIAVAIPAGILISFNIKPIKASVISLLANTATTSFGAVGLPVITLADVTKLNSQTLAIFVSLQLLLLCILVPFLLVLLVDSSFKELKKIWYYPLTAGLVYGIVQLVVSYLLGPELPTIVASLATLIVLIMLAQRKNKSSVKQEKHTLTEIAVATAPFILIFSLVLVTSPLFPQINNFLNNFQIGFQIYPGQDNGQTFSYLVSPGTIILLSAIIGGLVQKVSLQEQLKILILTLKSIWKTIITVCAIVALAKVMDYSGMTTTLATSLVKGLGPIYPLFAPIIGAIGSFATGSNTSSNVLFGDLQLSAAKNLGVNKYWLVASNMAGSTAGNMLSPQSIAVATTGVKLEGKEGIILKDALKWAGLYLGVICIFWYLIGLIFGMIRL